LDRRRHLRANGRGIVAGPIGERGAARWTLVGAPLDCSGTDRGEARAPEALREAGLGEAVWRDAGDADARIDDPVRDPRTGVIGFERLVEASSNVRSAVAAVFERGERPLVVGGDCSVLIGAVAAAKERFGRTGLAFLDGHVDYFGGRTSPSGEAADMDLAFVCGYGPEGLVDLAGPAPMVEPGDAVVMGHRPDPGDASPREDDLVDERTQLVEARAVRRGAPERLGRYVAQRLEAQAGRLWVHFDVDVFDEGEMPAVTYAQPGGLDWGQVEALLRPLVSAGALVGLSIADFEPDKDPDGHNARRLADLLARLLAR
jgi:arginase